MKSDLIKDLNPQQEEAVIHTNGPLLIVAGAGTGKTTVITKRIAWLIEQKLAEPEEILALTYTDKAANEMEERVDNLLPIGYVNTWISTFHAFCERILRDYAIEIGLPTDFRLLSEPEQWMMVRNNLNKFDLDYYRPLGNPSKFIYALINHFSRVKDEIITPKEYLDYVQGLSINKDKDIAHADEYRRMVEVANAYHVYQNILLENNAFDFADLICYTIKLIKERPKVLSELQNNFKYILVDEFQDTNVAQYELVKMLAKPKNNLAVMADDDQSIFAFRGASMSNILQFKKDYPDSKAIVLTDNYRSKQSILDLAYNFIQLNNPYRLEVQLKGDKGSGLSKKLKAIREGKGGIEHILYETINDEADGIIKKIIQIHTKEKTRWSDFAILVRANSSAPIIIKTLQKSKIPFDYLANKGLYKEPIILEAINYLRFLNNYDDSNSLYRVIIGDPFNLQHEDANKIASIAKKKACSVYDVIKNINVAGISNDGVVVIEKVKDIINKHALYLKTHCAAELYVKIIKDLEIEERVANPALMQDAQNLASFYERIKVFEIDAEDHSLKSFLEYLELEIQSGEEGKLPANVDEGQDTVKLITAHSAKGLEWSYVFIPHLIDRKFPSSERREQIEIPKDLIKETLPEGDVHLQEERRLFYVALTRARDGLFLTRAGDYLGKKTRKPSQFLFELGFVSEEEYKVKAKSIERPNIAQATTKVAKYPIPDSFSFSAIDAFKKCPMAYKYRYLLNIPSPGSAYLSFGNTIHKTLEQFLILWKSQQRSAQGDLFSGGGKNEIPTFEQLKQFYNRAWIDDWYDSADQKKEFKNVKGPHQLKNFYKKFKADLPNPKYIEKFFKIALGGHKFVGKIDRIDERSDGLHIIDYKTGNASPAKLEKVDKDQLIIYQIATEEFLREKIQSAVYWYLDPDAFSEPFIASQKDKDKLIEEYAEIIEKIIETVKTDSFEKAEENVSKHDCMYNI